MVSSNNLAYRWEHDSKTVPHYGLRKLGVGVASVLLGTTFGLGYTAAAHADTVADAGASQASATQATVATPTTTSTYTPAQTALVAQEQQVPQSPVETPISQPATASAILAQAPATADQGQAVSQAAAQPATSADYLYGPSLTATSSDPQPQPAPTITAPLPPAQSAVMVTQTNPETHRSWDMDVSYTYADQDKQFGSTKMYGVPDKAGQTALPDTKLHIDVQTSGMDPKNDKLTLTQSGTNAGKATYEFVRSYMGQTTPANPDDPTPAELAAGDVKGHVYSVYKIHLPLQQQIGWQYVSPTDYFEGTLTIDHVDNGRDTTQTHLNQTKAVFYQYGDHWKIHYHSDDGKIDQTDDGPFITSTNGVQKINYNIPQGYKFANPNQVSGIGMQQATDDPNFPAVAPSGGTDGFPGPVDQDQGVIDVPLTLAAIPSGWAAQFVDQDEGGKNVGNPYRFNGRAGESIEFNGKIQVPENYELAPGAKIPTYITFGKEPVTQKIPLVHKHKHYNPGDPGSDKYDLTRDVKRTINVNNPVTNKVDTTTQPVQLHRSVDVDLVTNQTNYGNWDTGKWPEFHTPDVIGWTPSIPQVEAKTVDANTEDERVDIKYTQDESSWTGQFVDKDNSNKPVGNPVKITGKVGDKVTPKMSIPDGYELPDGVTIPTEAVLPQNGINITIPLQHKHHVVHPGDPDGGQYPLTHDATRTIEFKGLDGVKNAPKSEIQKARVTRTAVVDDVTKQAVSYTPWTKSAWQAYNAPKVDGYTATPTSIPEAPVDENTKDTTAVINYAKNGSWTGMFIDKDNNNAPVGTPVSVTGDKGSKHDIKMSIPDGYELVPGNQIPTTVTMDGNDQVVKIPVQHKTHQVKPGDPNSDQFDLVHNATRTIEIKGLDGVKNAPQNTVQKAKVTRIATVDDVTGKVISYTPWTKDSWQAYNAPKVAGYTADPASVAQVAIDENTKDTTAVINYLRNGSWTGQFVDKDNGNKPVGDPLKITGDRGSKHDVKMPIPDNYELVPGTKIPTSVTMDGNDPVVKIPLQHKKQVVHPGDPDADKYDLTADVTRTIDIKGLDGVKDAPQSTKQDAKITRTATVDLVTKQVVSYSPWSTAQWDAYTPQKVDGYSFVVNNPESKDGDIPAIQISVPRDNTTVTITYAKNGSWIGQFVDQDNNGQTVGNPVVITGDKGTSHDVKMPIPDNFELAPNAQIPTSVTMDGTNQNVKIPLVHKHRTVTGDDPEADKYGTKMTITRTIIVHTPGDNSDETTKQPTTLKRTGDLDLVTGKIVSYTDWSEGQWPEFNVKKIDHYKASQDQVPAQTVTYNDKDTTVNVTYESMLGTWTGHFIDGDDGDKVVGTPVQVQGDAGTTQKVDMPIPENYELAPGQTIPDQVTMKQGTQTVAFKLVHKHKLVEAGDPDAKKYNLENLKKAVTRTIVFKGLDDKKDPVVQKVVLLRSADVDLVTGKATYNDWSTDEWPAFDVPTVDGYAADKTSIDSAKVDGTTEDQIVDVTYTKNKDEEPEAKPVEKPAEKPAEQPAANTNSVAAPSAPAAVQTAAPVATASSIAVSQPAANNAVAAPVATGGATKQVALPQTGNENIAGLLGLGLVSLSLGLGLIGKKQIG